MTFGERTCSLSLPSFLSTPLTPYLKQVDFYEIYIVVFVDNSLACDVTFIRIFKKIFVVEYNTQQL